MKKITTETMFVPFIALFFIGFALLFESPAELVNDFVKIQLSSSILISDYFYIGGVGAAFLNSGLLMMVSYLIVRKIKLPISGPIFAGILTIGGFAFFGKNLVNSLPLYLGVYLYSRYKHISLKGVIVVFLFSTGIAPISSLIMFGLSLPYFIGIPLGLIAGVFSGFILV